MGWPIGSITICSANQLWVADQLVAMGTGEGADAAIRMRGRGAEASAM